MAEEAAVLLRVPWRVWDSSQVVARLTEGFSPFFVRPEKCLSEDRRVWRRRAPVGRLVNDAMHFVVRDDSGFLGARYCQENSSNHHNKTDKKPVPSVYLHLFSRLFSCIRLSLLQK